MTLIGTGAERGVFMEHVHGLGYSSDGKRILIPAHDGIRIYENGIWYVPNKEKHDYMGFSTVDEGFYSSGHPAPGSELKNPLGIVKSKDEGKTLQTLALEGEIDFHNMAVGYSSHVVYVMNQQPNSKMSTAGLFYSTDEGSTWTKSEMKGITEELTSMAAHPTEASVVAIGTPTGVYLSKDHGNTFEKVALAGQVTSIFFNNRGDLIIGGYDNQAYLKRMDVNTKKVEPLSIPNLTEDSVAYFSQNPVDENQMVFATFRNDIYISNDRGLNWKKIADQGKTISEGSPESK
ncbi:hypothetical protein ABE38_17315 [Brevibacillus agri]|nr:hypothetical protein [Brevibacillus agri]